MMEYLFEYFLGLILNIYCIYRSHKSFTERLDTRQTGLSWQKDKHLQISRKAAYRSNQMRMTSYNQIRNLSLKFALTH